MRLRFSERNGYKSVKQVFQVDYIDNDTKNGLWNALTKHYWSRLSGISSLANNTILQSLVHSLWADYFKKPIDSITYNWGIYYQTIRNYFFSIETPWYEIYDFIEFVAYSGRLNPENFKTDCNLILERELSAYRFVGDYIAPIIDEVEILEIETAINDKTKTKFAAEHLSNALELLSDKTNPDYRNSIKESISAVESISKSIAGDSKGELKSALKALEESLGVKMHGALREGFLKIYGYTSDGDGIRHGLTEEANLSFEDAKFMLVACSAFVNYLVEKANKAGINLE